MSSTQMIIMIGSVLVPMLSGFKWISSRLDHIDKRLLRIEGVFRHRCHGESLRDKGE